MFLALENILLWWAFEIQGAFHIEALAVFFGWFPISSSISIAGNLCIQVPLELQNRWSTKIMQDRTTWPQQVSRTPLNLC